MKLKMIGVANVEVDAELVDGSICQPNAAVDIEDSADEEACVEAGFGAACLPPILSSNC